VIAVEIVVSKFSNQPPGVMKMELRAVDPRTIKANPNNPRRTAPIKESDAQLLASIKTLGMLQPPVVAPNGDHLIVIAGNRRIKAAIKLKHTEILVLVRDPEEDKGQMAAVSENLVREPMGAVDQWRAFQALSSAGWNDTAIASALGITKKALRQQRLFGRILPAMLDQMARGDEPEREQIEIIALASQENQADIWKAYKPQTKNERANWSRIANALDNTRYYARDANFDNKLAEAFNIVWEEDLFEQANEDPKYTTQVEEFLAAQTEWIQTQLNDNTFHLPIDKNGTPILPDGAKRNWGDPQPGDKIGYYVQKYDGTIRTVTFQIDDTVPQDSVSTTSTHNPQITPPGPKTRAPITQKGQALIGEYRTEALRKALIKNDFDDSTLIGLLILGLSANNVSIQNDSPLRPRDLTLKLTEDGRITKDIDLLRETARKLLASLFSCLDNATNSGLAARIAGDTIGADQHLGNMGTEEFLSCLSKTAIEETAAAIGINARDRAKDTRAAVITQVGTTGFVLPAAHFALAPEELKEHQTPTPAYGYSRYRQEKEDDVENPGSEESDEPNLPSNADHHHTGDDPKAFHEENSDENHEHSDPRDTTDAKSSKHRDTPNIR
jgi:ParB/RepB/Spo0J family partition protein